MGIFSKKPAEAILPAGGAKDPIRQGPMADQELFRKMSSACNGFDTQAAVAASGNVLLNALRQQHAKRPEAEKAFDELFGRLKAILMEHYDGPSGRRRNVFPHNQVIEVPFFTGKRH